MGCSIFVVTASAQYLNQGLNELQEIDGSARVLKLVGNGIAIMETKMEKNEFIEAVKNRKPIFIRHMNSVDHIIDIEACWLQKVAQAVREYDSIESGYRIAVQVRKAAGDYPCSTLDVKNTVDAVLVEEMGAVPEVRNPELIISVLLYEEKCFMGLCSPDDNLSSWSGGMMHFRKTENDISRARYKLMEAIEVFNIDMGKFRSALDLGAAPGGWTSVLLEHGLQVTAVDTGDMDDRLAKYPGFRFIKANASELVLENESFDLLTSDISWNPKNTARLINRASRYLAAGGTAIVTLKLMGNKVRKTIKEVLALYSEVFDILQVKQLFHNRDEVTLYLRKR